MKKVMFFALMAAVSVTALVSCNKEIETPDLGTDVACPEGYYVEELTAVYPSEPETRTAFNETSGKFAWTEGDELAFHLSNGEYTSAPIDPATSKVKLYLPVGVTRDNFAVYPASAVVDGAAEHGNMKVTLPDTYDISGNLQTDFVETPLIAINDADNKHLKFEHAGALLQFNLNVPAGVKTAKVSLGKTITGEFTLDEDASGNGAIEAGTATDDDFVTFVLSNEDTGLAEASAVKLLTPLPTGTYESVKIAYDNGFEFSKDLSTGWTFDRSGGKKVSIGEDKFEDKFNCFWIQAEENNTRIYWSYASGASPELYYSYNSKNNFERASIGQGAGGSITLANKGDRVYCYNLSDDLGTMSSNWTRLYVSGGKISVGGEIMYLCSKGEKQMSENCFAGLFMATGARLVDASELILPDYTVKRCYYRMFEGVKGLLSAPSLPATEVAESAYANMFYGCSALTDLPEMTFDSVGPQACNSMFMYCTGLTCDISFSLSHVGHHGMKEMFNYCSGLTDVSLFTNEIANQSFWGTFSNCTGLLKAETGYNVIVDSTGSTGTFSASDGAQMTHMFENCSSLCEITFRNSVWPTESIATYLWVSGVATNGTFYKKAALPCTYGTSNIPEGWTVYDIEEVGAGI